MHGVGAADGLRRGLGESEIAHLALSDELGHGADGLFDRHRLVDAVLVVEVDVLDTEALQRGFAGGVHVLGPSVDADPAAVLAAHVAELGGEHDRVAAPRDGATDEPFVGVADRRCRPCRGASTPSSSARWIVAIDSVSSVAP